MQFSDGEKLILVMLSDIYEKLGIDTGMNPKVIREAIYGGHHWAIEWEHQAIFPRREDAPEDVTLVVDVLDMWRFIETAFENLNEQDKEQLQRDAEPFGQHVFFTGFDGNNEPQSRSIALMLTKTLGQFERFADRDLNSHAPLIPAYQRMLKAFEPIRARLVGREMSLEELAIVLQAKRHPNE